MLDAGVRATVLIIVAEMMMGILPHVGSAVAVVAWCAWSALLAWVLLARRVPEEPFPAVLQALRTIPAVGMARGAALIVLYCLAGLAAQVLYVTAVGKPGSSGDIEDSLYRPGGWIPFMLFTVVLAPIVEEAALRGYLLGRVRALYGAWAGIAAAAVLFAALHLSLVAFPLFMVDGVVLGIVAVRTSSVWLAIAMHASSNLALLFLSLWYGPNSSALDFPEQVHLPLSMFGVILVALAIAFAWLLRGTTPSMNRDGSPAVA